MYHQNNCIHNSVKSTEEDYLVDIFTPEDDSKVKDFSNCEADKKLNNDKDTVVKTNYNVDYLHYNLGKWKTFCFIFTVMLVMFSIGMLFITYFID